jgi:CheY-like chemotaxis protein
LPQIEADRGQVQQVFMNLAINAAEAIGSDPGLISVATGAQVVDDAYIRRNPEAAELSPGTYVYLEVSDTGCGMDAATRMKIFDPFFTTKFTGRGLGLAAVSGIVRGHKGAIRVLSEPGKGSRFTVLLPAAQGAMPARQAIEDRAAPNVTGTVLVVDDEEIVRDTATKTLRLHGFDVLSANSGLEAIETVKLYSGKISLILLDLSMPGMSGAQALPEIQKMRPEIKILVSSGYNEIETMALFKGHEVAGFIQKPYTSKRLSDKVKSALGA